MLEDPRLSRMYASLLMRRIAAWRHNLWQSMVKRSGLLITLVAVILILLIAVALKERGRGNLSRLKTKLGVNAPILREPEAPRPGDQDVVVLEHAGGTDADGPEFVSATLLPGRGLNVLQIKAYLPQKGNIDLLASPSLKDAAKQMTGDGEDADGGASLRMGGAIEIPWAGHIWGTPSGDKNIAVWHGHDLHLPQDENGTGEGAKTVSTGGLLLNRRADTVKTNVMPDGGQVQAVYNAGDFDGNWISHTLITTTVQLNSRSLDINIAAQNTGDEDEPIGIGWCPRFAIPSGDRSQVTLKLPEALHAEAIKDREGLPSGKLLPVQGTPYDFTRPNGAKLGSLSLDDSFVQLKQGLLDSGPIAEFRDPRSGYGLRITVLSPAIQAIQVYAPANASFISIAPQFNNDDPLGHEWAKENTGMVVLQPGQTAKWKIRLEIFALTNDPSQPM